MDRHRHAVGQRRGAGVHALGAFRAHGQGVMLIAPVEVVIGKQIDAHAERAHPAKLRRIRKLAVLQGEAVIRRGVVAKRQSERIEHQFGRLVAVGVAVDLDAGRERALEDFAQLFRRDVPQPVGRAVVVSRRLQPRRKSLDRAVDHDLDGAEPQTVRTQACAVRQPGRPARPG